MPRLLHHEVHFLDDTQRHGICGSTRVLTDALIGRKHSSVAFCFQDWEPPQTEDDKGKVTKAGRSRIGCSAR